MFINNTNNAFNCNIINMTKIAGFCSLNLYRNIRNNPDKILDLFGDIAPDFVTKAINMTGKGSATLDVFTTVFGTNPNIKGERHTALYDTQLLSNALVNYLQKELKDKK